MNRTLRARRPELNANARVTIGKASHGPTERTKWKPGAAPPGTTGYLTELRELVLYTRRFTREAIDRCVAVMRTSGDPRLVLAAADMILDRSLPKQLAVLARITGEDETLNANRRLMETLPARHGETGLVDQVRAIRAALRDAGLDEEDDDARSAAARSVTSNGAPVARKNGARVEGRVAALLKGVRPA